MNSDSSTRTMRIDIHPDFLGQTLARKRQMAAARDTSRDTSFLLLERAAHHLPEEFRKLLESIYDAVLIADTKGRIVDFNTRATEFFLCDECDLSGMNVLSLISGADESLLESIEKNLEEHRYTLIEAHCQRLDKSTFPAEIAVNRINLNEQGQLCFFVRDISVRKRAQEALEEAVRRLEEHDRARSEFVSSVSHELRTPLTSMIYAVTNLLRGVAGPLGDDVLRYVELLDADSRRLLGTVNDILDLRQAEMNTLKLVRTRVPFARLVRRGVDGMRMQSDPKGLHMNVMVKTGMRFVDCDAHKMERVVLNLVGNSIKFTPANGTIEVIIDDDPARAAHVRMTVRDTGVGIPSEAIGHVMDMYFTVGEQACGSGLGLAISRQIVELHGGQIAIQSPPDGYDQGTAVSVSLPVVQPPSILVVEDQAEVRSALAGQLASEGYQSVEAAGGEKALEEIERRRTDLVLLDMALPDMSGKDVILRMKADKTSARIPIVVVTGAEIDAQTARVLDGFSIPVLGKPWSEAELFEQVEGALIGTARIGA